MNICYFFEIADLKVPSSDKSLIASKVVRGGDSDREHQTEETLHRGSLRALPAVLQTVSYRQGELDFYNSQ